MDAPFRLDLFDSSTFPTRRDEAWRYTDLKRALGRAPSWAPPASADVVDGPFKSIIVDDLAFVNGRYVLDGTSNTAEAIGIGPTNGLRWVTKSDGAGWQASLGLTVRSKSNGGQTDHGVLLESYESDAVNYAAHALLNIVVQEGASLTRLVIASDAADAISVSTARIRVEAGATFRQFILTNGAKLQRFETHVDVEGEGATVELNGVYMSGPGRHADLTSVVQHKVGGGQTHQLVKGVARKGGRGVFQGKIVVAPHAQQTDARQFHHGILLDEGAEIYAKPELMIHADDVQCAHGNTAGGLDEQALFYMRSRGVPEAEARALLVEAFLVEGIPEGLDASVRDILADRIGGWLRGAQP